MKPQIELSLGEAIDAAVDVLIRNVTGEWELSRAFMMMSVFDPLDEGTRRDGQPGPQGVVRRKCCCRTVARSAMPTRCWPSTLPTGCTRRWFGAGSIFGLEHELYYGFDDETLYRELKQALTRYLQGVPAAPADTG